MVNRVKLFFKLEPLVCLFTNHVHVLLVTIENSSNLFIKYLNTKKKKRFTDIFSHQMDGLAFPLGWVHSIWRQLLQGLGPNKGGGVGVGSWMNLD